MKVRDYATVSTLRHYGIVESTGVGVMLLSRGGAAQAWTVMALTGEDMLALSGIGDVAIPVSAVYEDVEFSPDADG